MSSLATLQKSSRVLASNHVISTCKNFVKLNLPELSPQPITISNIYLRDNSQSKYSFNPLSNQRIHNTVDIDLNVYAVEATVKETGEEGDNKRVDVLWSDHHRCEYSFDWIRENVVRKQLEYKVKKQTWKSTEIRTSLQNLLSSYHDLFQNRDILKTFYQNVWKYGFAFLTGCPIDPEASVNLAKYVGSVMHSKEYFDGIQQYYELSNTNGFEHFDIAYTNASLGLHTDNPQFQQPGGLVTLQPVVPSQQGGESILVDSFRVAEEVRSISPEAFEILSTWPVTHELGYNIASGPIIETYHPNMNFSDCGTDIRRVKFSEMNRSPWQPCIKQEDMKKWYWALRKFNQIATSNEFVFKTLLARDTMLVFDNWRMLHGRTSFVGERKLVGCFVPYEDWTEKARKCGAI